MQETKLTLTGIAGFCPEPAVWQLVADLCDIVQAHRSGAYLAPENIIADHYSFRVDDTGVEAQEFQAPETAATGQVTDAQCVWSMGALIYYCTLGRVVFGGHGSAYQRQHPDVALPVLPKTHRALTPVLHRCLCTDPAQRIGLQELRALAHEKLGQLSTDRPRREPAPQHNDKKQPSCHQKSWPEEMT